jgi:phosphatidylglycerophosphate synthase
MVREPYQPSQRRPIRARNWKGSQLVADYLANKGVSANAISIAGMFCGIAAGAALAATPHVGAWQRGTWVAAALLVQLRLAANLLDGMVAVASGRASAVGELFNEVPDRVSDAATLIGAGYAVDSNVPLGYGAACVALFTAYVRAMGKVAGAHQEFCGPMAKQQRMFIVTVVALYYGLAPLDWRLVWNVPAPMGLAAGALLLILVGGLVTAARRLYRIARVLTRFTP